MPNYTSVNRTTLVYSYALISSIYFLSILQIFEVLPSFSWYVTAVPMELILIYSSVVLVRHYLLRKHNKLIKHFRNLWLYIVLTRIARMIFSPALTPDMTYEQYCYLGYWQMEVSMMVLCFMILSFRKDHVY